MAVVREATIQDAQALLEHVKAVFKTSPFTLTSFDEFNSSEESQTKWIEDMQRQRNLILVALENGKVVGDLRLVRGSKRRNAHTGEIAIGLQQEYRGQGIGTQMMGTMIAWARNTNEIEKICLQVMSGNVPAIHLYNKMGFVEEGRLKNQVKFSPNNYADLINMSLFL
jgi:RimJ/RimL family protein N-acetyltransferase